MAAYKTSTQPLIEYYRQRNLLITVAAADTPEETYQRTLAQLQTFPSPTTAATTG